MLLKCVREDTCLLKILNIRGELRNDMLKDEDVLFYWCRAGQIEGDDAAEKSLAMIVDLWI